MARSNTVSCSGRCDDGIRSAKSTGQQNFLLHDVDPYRIW
jgi:hypothetical protein